MRPIAPIVTQQDFDNYQKLENGFFYVASVGQVLTLQNKFKMNKLDADHLYKVALESTADIIRNPTHPQDRDDGIEILRNLSILPFRFH